MAALREATYAIPQRGLATSFTESELPPQYASSFRNRFINAAGGAEKRQGLIQLGDTVAGTPELTNLHELVKSDSTTELFTTGGEAVFRFDTSAWTQVHSGLDSSARVQSVQMGDKLIFVNGEDRNLYTVDGTTFKELKAINEQGEVSSTSSSIFLADADIDNWVTDTNVVENDILINLTQSAKAVITSVGTAGLDHTAVGSAATGSGVATNDQQTGDRYEIIDGIALNIVPTDGEDDNIGTLGTGSSATGIALSAVADWTKTEVRKGDFVRNTTRTAVTEVTAITTAQLRVKGISGQVVGDSIVLLKSAMPIAERAHVHFGRLYLIDSRDQRLVRISGPNDPQDFTTGAGTLDSTTFKYGEQQPQGDAMVGMASYQRFLGLAGRKNLLLFSGVDPIADTSAASVDFDIIGLFPQGVIASEGMISIGNDLVFVTPDGIQTAALAGDASTLGRSNISEALKSTIRDELKSAADREIFAFHYPKRSWFCLKIGSFLYVFNYTAFFGQEALGQTRAGGTLTTTEGSWSRFDGKFARQNAFLVRRNSDLVCCGAGGKVFLFDQDTFDDDGDVIQTEFQTGWLTGDEPKKSVRTKVGQYIKPVIDAGDNISYTIRAEAGFDAESSESITIQASGGGSEAIGLAEVGKSVIGGAAVQDVKHPLRWRGREVRLTFTTSDKKGPDILSRYTLYMTAHGKR